MLILFTLPNGFVTSRKYITDGHASIIEKICRFLLNYVAEYICLGQHFCSIFIFPTDEKTAIGRLFSATFTLAVHSEAV